MSDIERDIAEYRKKKRKEKNTFVPGVTTTVKVIAGIRESTKESSGRLRG